jgi:hypothetical protein
VKTDNLPQGFLEPQQCEEHAPNTRVLLFEAGIELFVCFTFSALKRNEGEITTSVCSLVAVPYVYGETPAPGGELGGSGPAENVQGEFEGERGKQSHLGIF